MGNSKGRRFDEEPKLNMKKVFATLIALLVIIMVIASIIIAIKRVKIEKNEDQEIKYFSAYTNSKWTVINSKGEQLTGILYDEMVVVPNNRRDIFIVSYDVNYTDETYKTKAINEKNEQLFSQYDNVSAIMNYQTVDDVWADDEVLRVEKNNKFGLIDFDGKEVLSPEYDEINSLQGLNKIVLTTKENKKGLFNTITKTNFLEPTYAEIKPFGKDYSEGFIVQDENGKFGLISSEGKEILSTKYETVYPVSGADKYVVKEEGTAKLITREGTTILDTGFEEITEITGETLVIKNNGKFGVISTNGDNLIDTAFDSLTNCFGNYYIASTAGKYGILNLNKDIEIEFKYTNIEYRNDITALVCENEDYTSDIYNRELQKVLTGTISKADVENGYIRIRVSGEYKYYNLQYQEISSQEALKNNTLFLVKEDGKYGYINKDGDRIVDCIYDDATEQNEFGFCAVNKDGKWGALQSNGSVILEPSVTLDNTVNINFIGGWHLNENLELNTYVR